MLCSILSLFGAPSVYFCRSKNVKVTLYMGLKFRIFLFTFCLPGFIERLSEFMIFLESDLRASCLFKQLSTKKVTCPAPMAPDGRTGPFWTPGAY